jgi:hypothetical protein
MAVSSPVEPAAVSLVNSECTSDVAAVVTCRGVGPMPSATSPSHTRSV